jgi:hypothetical protein
MLEIGTPASSGPASDLHAAQPREKVPETQPGDRRRRYERRMALWLAGSYLAIFPMAAAVGVYALRVAMWPFRRPAAL